MEKRTTFMIHKELRQLVLNAKNLDSIEKRENYNQKEWVAVDDVVKLLKSNLQTIERALQIIQNGLTT